MDESKFTRSAWVTLLLTLGLFVFSTAWMFYYFTFPTDGWWTTKTEFGAVGLAYKQNLVGAPSALQSEDYLIAVEGITSETQDFSALADRWQVGQTVRYTVVRNGLNLDVQAPLVSWQLVPALRYWVLQSGGWISCIGMLLFLGIATLAFFKRPNDHAAQALFLYAALFPALTALTTIIDASVSANVFPVLSIPAGIATFIAYSLLYPPTLLRFALVFPHPKPIVQRHPWLEYLPYLIGLFILPLFVLQIFIAGYAWTIFSIVGAIVILIHSVFTMRDALSRAQLMWGLLGFALGSAMILASFLVTFGAVSGMWADIINEIASLSFSVLGITLAIAILRYRLFDIDIIIRRTVTYTIVVTLLGIVFFGSVILLQQIFARFTNTGGNEIITVVSTLLIAALFVPLRNKIQDAIDRRFNRRKYDAQKVLEKFAITVRDETDIDKLTAELVNVVQETMQPRSVSLWLKTTDDRRRTADSTTQSAVRRPLSK